MKDTEEAGEYHGDEADRSADAGENETARKDAFGGQERDFTGGGRAEAEAGLGDGQAREHDGESNLSAGEHATKEANEALGGEGDEAESGEHVVPHHLATKKVEIALTRLHTQLAGIAASALDCLSKTDFRSMTGTGRPRRVRRRRLDIFQIVAEADPPPTCAVCIYAPFMSCLFKTHKTVDLPPPSIAIALQPTRCSQVPSTLHRPPSHRTSKQAATIAVVLIVIYYLFRWIRSRKTPASVALGTRPEPFAAHTALPGIPLVLDPPSTGPEPHSQCIPGLPLVPAPAAVRRFPIPSPPRQDRLLGALWPLSSRLAVPPAALGLLGAIHQALKENLDSPRQAGWGVIQEWVELRLSALRRRAVRRSPARLAAALRCLEQQERAELVEVCEGVMRHDLLSHAEAEELIGILTNLGFHGSERLAEGERSLGRNFVERRVGLDTTSLSIAPSELNASAGTRLVGGPEGSGVVGDQEGSGGRPLGGLTVKDDNYLFFAS
ncbi:hypothetical protein C8R43DRAFT_1191590 [Mycena crocata]|nr:hypothetical protein C8R43DRAFT_1191590 [Mycena crocata]